MATLNELWPGVETSLPNDPMPLLVAADWCDENDKPGLGYALRWCAAHRRRPHLRNDVVKSRWQWIRDQKKYGGTLSWRKVQHRLPAVLSPLLFTANGYDENQNSFSTSHAAYYWLASGLDKLRKIVEMRKIVLPTPPAIVALGPVTCSQCGIMRERERLSCPVCNSSEVK